MGTPSAVASMGTAALSSVHGVGAKANEYRVAASIADLRCERRVSYQHATLWTASGREVVATPERPSSRANIVSAAVRLARVRGIERGGGAGDERGGGGGREAAPLLAKTNEDVGSLMSCRPPPLYERHLVVNRPTSWFERPAQTDRPQGGSGVHLGGRTPTGGGVPTNWGGK